jgi:hypothetical protein
MPQLRKLTEEEVRGIENKGKGQRKLVEEEYDRYLADYELGEYGEAELGQDENRLTVRNRFKAAAERRGVALQFPRTTGNTIRFQVVSRDGMDGQAQLEDGTVAATTSAPSETMETPVSSDEIPAPPKKKGGRPKKQAA